MNLRFKYVITAALSLALGIGICGAALAAETEDGTDYMALMISAAANGDPGTGAWAESARNAKIDRMGLDNAKISFEELSLLSRIIYAEAGSNWIPDEWKMCVGEVVLNRVGSPEFPDTLRDVLTQPGQYYGAYSSYFNNLQPSERCVRIALSLLEGERYLNDSSVVFQANFRQGSSVHTAFYDPQLGWTFFCVSTRPYLY